MSLTAPDERLEDSVRSHCEFSSVPNRIRKALPIAGGVTQIYKRCGRHYEDEMQTSRDNVCAYRQWSLSELLYSRITLGSRHRTRSRGVLVRPAG